MPEQTTTIGVMIDTETRYGRDYLVIRVMRREAGDGHPLNNSFGVGAEYGEFADLVMEGSVSDFGEPSFHGMEKAEYEKADVTLRRAKEMVKVLSKIEKQIAKDVAYEKTDIFMSFCKAVGAKWVCHRDNGDKATRSSYAENKWRWLTIPEGREYLRHMIGKMIAAEKARKAA